MNINTKEVRKFFTKDGGGIGSIAVIIFIFLYLIIRYTLNRRILRWPKKGSTPMCMYTNIRL